MRYHSACSQEKVDLILFLEGTLEMSFCGPVVCQDLGLERRVRSWHAHSSSVLNLVF